MKSILQPLYELDPRAARAAIGVLLGAFLILFAGLLALSPPALAAPAPGAAYTEDGGTSFERCGMEVLPRRFPGRDGPDLLR